MLVRIADGDSEAFEVLYKRFVRPVFALALRRLGDRGRAEDATQETFTSVWRSARSYKPEFRPVDPTEAPSLRTLLLAQALRNAQDR